ncbi:MAG: SGNH/GDSL hydrolase family protein [bacterium]
MKQLKLNGPHINWEHVEELSLGNSGVIPQRFPTSAINSFGNMARIARMTAGIEMQVQGQISQLEIKLRLLDSDLYGVTAELFSGPHKLLPTWNLDPYSTDIQTMTFDIENNFCSQYPIRFIFPTHCTLEIISVSVDDNAEMYTNFKSYDYSENTEQPGKKWLVHGDSITQGSNVSSPSCTWVDLTARMLNMIPINLGIGSYGRAELEMAEYIASRQDFDVLSLHMGINCATADDIDDFPERFQNFLSIIRKSHQNKPIIVCTPIYSHFEMGINAAGTKKVRKTMTNTCQKMQMAGDKQLFLINGLDIIDDPYYLRADVLHLSDFGAMKYAIGIVPYLQTFLKESEKVKAVSALVK